MSALDAVKVGEFFKRGYKPSGVIHVGANDGEEIQYYLELGLPVIAFEPLTAAYERLRANYPDVPAYKVGWGILNETVLINVTENDKASSVLPTWPVDDPATHPVYKDWNQGQWPVVGQEEIKIVSFEDFPIDFESFNKLDTLVMDVQGMELEALEGMGKRLNRFNFLVIELSAEPVYDGEAPASKVCNYLALRGFEQITPILPHDDVLFVRKEVM